MSDVPPKRFESELTVVIDRDLLPPKPDLEPVSTIAGMTIEMLADAERARRDAQDAIDTLVACPGPCATCPCCKGAFMVSHERRKQWLAGSEPPPEAA